MSQFICSGALVKCSFGAAPSAMMVTPVNATFTGGLPAATIFDSLPGANITSFGTCSSLLNPAVAAATAAALGTLTPMPCSPVTGTPWVPGSPTVSIRGKPALTPASTCLCAYAGVITISLPGQFKALVQ